MSDLINKDYLTNDGAFVLWGVLVLGAVIKFAYSSRCGRRAFEEMVDPEEAEARRQQKAAEERLCKLLDASIGVRPSLAVGLVHRNHLVSHHFFLHTQPFKATEPKQTMTEGDIEEGQGSREKQVEGSSDDADTNEVRAFSNACAICLEEFEEGVNVVKSVATGGCPLIFHYTCLNEVIAASTRKGIYIIPCPCCRQTFVETDPPEQRSDEVQQ